MQNLVTLRGNIHPLARPEFDQGVAPDDLPMERMLLVLQRGPEQEVALRQLLDDQQVKSSPRFHQWLTPEQFGQQFGPADSDIQAVTDWLTGQGFQVCRVSAGRTVIEFSGTAGLVHQALGTEIHKFTVNDKDYWANANDPQIPAALAPVVAGFASLNNFPRKPLTHRLGTFTRSKATGEVQPLFTFSPQPNGYLFAVGPTDFATIYNVSPLWNANTDGTGQTIAVVAEGNINPQDVADFRAMFGLPVNPPNIILNGPDPGINGDESEADLDVQWSGAVAKGATIDLVVSESTEATPGVDLSAIYIIDNNLAPIMSASYGGCEAELGAGGNQFHSTLWEQAAAQGITVLIAAGDSGSATCDRGASSAMVALAGFSVNGLASTPFDVAVGGTDFADTSNPLTYWSLTDTSSYQSSALSYIPESTWNDTCAASGALTGCANASGNTGFSEGIDLAAGGGGPSNCINSTGTYPNFTCSRGYPKPSWQSGTSVPQDGARDVPDLSLFAGIGLHYSFYVFCQMDANASNEGSSTSCNLNSPYTNFQGAGGTSISVQAFAGIMALVNQKYGRQGNANYVLYPLAAQNPSGCNSSTTATTNSACIFYDITAGNNSVACAGGSPQCSNTTSGQYGLLISGSPPTPAWTTTTGYDLATGWGSVNAANLVNKWSPNFTPSTTTLSLSTSPATNPITLTHGQPINFNINVTSGSGTPAGDVSLIAQPGGGSSNATGIGPFTLNGGSISGSTVMLPGGNYNVTAHYAGNGTFAASNSSPGVPVSVGKEPSQTEVRLVTPNAAELPVYNVTTVPYGSLYGLRMDVTNSSGLLCTNATTGLVAYPCPTGSLSVSPAPTDQNPPKGTVPGSYVLNSEGYAEDQPIQQTPGTYNFVASYAGDNSYNSSTSPTVPITITKAPTTTTFTGLPSTAVGGVGPLTVTVNTTSSGVAPSCCPQFLLNGSTVINAGGTVGGTGGSATGYASLWASLYPILPIGPSIVAALYPGDSNYAGSTSAAVSITITDFSLSANPSPVTISAPGHTGISTISVAPQYGFTGTVNLYVDAGCPTGATCTLSPSSVTVSSASAVTSTLTITTTAASSAPPVLQRRVPPSFRLPVGLLWLLAGSLALTMLLSSPAVRRRPAGWLLASALVLVGIWAACGGSGGGGGTPAPGPAPVVSLSLSNLTFGSWNTGTPSVPQSLILTNTGNALLSISSVTVTGTNSTDFSQTNTCGSSVAAGANCSISVTFTPTAAGSRSASLTITDNASGSPQTVSIIGTGLAVPVVSLSSASLNFGQQIIYIESAAQTETISNIGNGLLSFSSFSIGGTNSTDFIIQSNTNTCSSIAAGANCPVSVVFNPQATGSRSASLTLSDNASNSPQTVSLTGTGVLPPTPAGNYLVQVNAIVGNDEHFITIPVTVQ
jgi:hypothetical protein